MHTLAISYRKRRKLRIRQLAAMFLVIVLLATNAFALAENLTQPTKGISKTTGEPSDKPYQPFLVLLNNAALARPLVNLSEADIVYEMIIWGPGHTRYAAIYNDNHPEKVGSIRSSRYYHEILREEWDCPLVAYGKSSDAAGSLPEPDGAQIPDPFMFNGIRSRNYSQCFYRDASRAAPNNALVKLSLLAENHWPDDPDKPGQPFEPRAPLFQFSSTPTQGEQAADTIEIHFEGIAKEKPNFLVSYTYNPETQAYDRSYCGYPQMDGESGKRIVANNVIVQYCKTAYYQNELRRPVINLTGEGAMDAYIDGTQIQGIWKREEGGQTQFYTAEGEVLQLRPGNTFIQVIPTTYGFDYDESVGLCRYAPDIE